jgi:hypothetical protein
MQPTVTISINEYDTLRNRITELEKIVESRVAIKVITKREIANAPWENKEEIWLYSIDKTELSEAIAGQFDEYEKERNLYLEQNRSLSSYIQKLRLKLTSYETREVENAINKTITQTEDGKKSKRKWFF